MPQLFVTDSCYIFVQVTCQSDLFSLGITIFFCATGRFPFCKASDDALTIQYRVSKDDSPAERLVLLEHVDSTWQDGLAAIVARALEKSTKKRYATAEDMLADLNKTRRFTSFCSNQTCVCVFAFLCLYSNLCVANLTFVFLNNCFSF